MRQKWFRSLLRSRFFIVLLLIVQVLFLVYVLKSGSEVSARISNIMTLISLCTSIYIISKKDKGAYKLTWVFMILLFPLFGGLFYLMFNFQLSYKKYGKRMKAIERKAKRAYGLLDNSFAVAQEKLPEYMPQIEYMQSYAGFPIYENTGTKYLTPGEVKFEYLVEELKKAEKYIFLEYFIVQEGKMWNTILEILKEKASRGVLVRLIYDDMGCFFLLPMGYAKELEKYGIECKVFNRFRPFLSTVQNNRDHRKIAVIDGKVAFTGGINLADEYINAYEKHGHWKDASIMLSGKAAWSFTLIFLQMWELCTKQNEDYSKYFPWKETTCDEKSDGFVQPYADSPIDKDNVGEHVYLQIIGNAKKYVYINTPYLIIDDSMTSALCLAAKSGVDVRIVTPHIGDKWWVHLTTRSYYRELIKAGVKIYEYTTGFIHSKTFVADDKVATIGTTNLDFRSLYLHFECGVKLFESKAVAEIKEDFIKTLDICHQIKAEDCRANFLVRIIQDVMRIFAPLM